MTTFTAAVLTALIFVAALLYASVGQAGASGYLAVMALFGVAPQVMKPTALVLNILVATVATIRFYRARCFSWGLFWPFVLTSIPFAFLGGSLTLPPHLYKPIVGLALIYAAYRFFRTHEADEAAAVRPLPLGWALIAGAAIGLLSGLTGVGGGIFLTPLLLFAHWADARHAAGVSAAFILINSVAGLLGHLSSMADLPHIIPLWGAAALIGGYLGATYGSQRLGNVTLRRILAAVLVIAGLRMLLT